MGDPVCVSTYGHAPLVDNASGSLADETLSLATLVTPNKSEGELILSHEQKEISISTLGDIVSALWELLLTLGPMAVLLKGGHATTTMMKAHDDGDEPRDPGV